MDTADRCLLLYAGESPHCMSKNIYLLAKLHAVEMNPDENSKPGENREQSRKRNQERRTHTPSSCHEVGEETQLSSVLSLHNIQYYQ